MDLTLMCRIADANQTEFPFDVPRLFHIDMLLSDPIK